MAQGTDAQLALYNLQPLLAAGYKGNGIVMTVIDGGFHNYPVGEHSGNSLSNTFDTAHWLGSYDFTDDTTNFYGATGYHGTMCLSLIAGDCPGTQESPPAKKSPFQGDLEGFPGTQASPPASKEVRSPGRTKNEGNDIHKCPQTILLGEKPRFIPTCSCSFFNSECKGTKINDTTK